MLLGMEASSCGTAFAEMEKLAEGVAELGQGLQPLPIVRLAIWRLSIWKLPAGGLGRFPHSNIISHYDIYLDTDFFIRIILHENDHRSCDELQLLVAGFCILRVWVVRCYLGGVRMEDDFGPAFVAIRG